MEVEQSVEEPSAEPALPDSEGFDSVGVMGAEDTILEIEELATPEAEIFTGLEVEGMGQPAVEEGLDVPVDNLETPEPQTDGEECEDAVLLSDQPGRDLPASETFEKDEDPFIGEHLSRKSSIKAKVEEDEGPEVLDPGTPEPGIQHQGDEAPLEQPENLRISHEEQLELLQDLQAERDKLSQINSQLQVKLSDYFRRKTGEDPRPERKNALSDLQERYQMYLEIMEDLKRQQLRESELHQQQAEELRKQSQEKLEQVEREWRAQLDMEYELVATAVTLMPGKQAAQAEVEHLQQAEQQQEEELVAVRLENIKLKMKMRKLEAELKPRENLYLVDFEQLKLENQTYIEKIEERNKEILKLRKKIANTVKVLAHMKEQLQFVRVQNQDKRVQLAEMDAAVAQKRDILTRTKQARDGLRADNLCLQQRCGLLGQTTLLRDFEEKVDVREGLERRLEMLKRRHAELTLKCAGVKKKLEQSMEQ